MQINCECCGVDNYSDWHNTTWSMENPGVLAPVSCCKDSIMDNCSLTHKNLYPDVSQCVLVCACMHACVSVCMHACVRACTCACVRACVVNVLYHSSSSGSFHQSTSIPRHDSIYCCLDNEVGFLGLVQYKVPDLVETRQCTCVVTVCGLGQHVCAAVYVCVCPGTRCHCK